MYAEQNKPQFTPKHPAVGVRHASACSAQRAHAPCAGLSILKTAKLGACGVIYSKEHTYIYHYARAGYSATLNSIAIASEQVRTRLRRVVCTGPEIGSRAPARQTFCMACGMYVKNIILKHAKKSACKSSTLAGTCAAERDMPGRTQGRSRPRARFTCARAALACGMCIGNGMKKDACMPGSLLSNCRGSLAALS